MVMQKLANTSISSVSAARGSIAMVVGATGIVGRELIAQLLAEPIDEWPTVYAVTRRSMPDTLREIGFQIPIDPACAPTFQRVIWLILDLSDKFAPDRLNLEFEWLRRPPTLLFYAGLAVRPHSLSARVTSTTLTWRYCVILSRLRPNGTTTASL